MLSQVRQRIGIDASTQQGHIQGGTLNIEAVLRRVHQRHPRAGRFGEIDPALCGHLLAVGEIPLDAEIRSGGDSGRPVAAADAPSAQGAAFAEVAGAVLQKLTASGSGSVFERFRQVWGKDDPRG